MPKFNNSDISSIELKTKELMISYYHYCNKQIDDHEDSLIALLFSVSQLLRQNLSVNEALQYYINLVVDICDLPVGHVYFVHPDADTPLVPSNIWSLRDEIKYEIFKEMTMQSNFKIGQSLPGMVLLKQRSCWIEDLFSVTYLRRAQAGIECELRAGFGVPIFCYGKIFAIAEFFSTETAAEDKNLLNMVELTSILLSTMIERKHKEDELQEYIKILKDTQQELVNQSKLASIGELSAGIAHELNTPIGFVLNNTQMLVEISKPLLQMFNMVVNIINSEPIDYSQIVNLKRYLKNQNISLVIENFNHITNDSIDGLERVKEIVNNLRQFARHDENEMSLANINDCIDSALIMVGGQLKHKCGIESNLAKIPEIMCHKLQISQVITNMLINASQAINKNGKISITTACVDNNIVLEITDNGKGIEPENLDKIFDPFFTTKKIGDGTGLGLSVSYGIIESHGGKINVDSKLGRGTTFTIILPINTQP